MKWFLIPAIAAGALIVGATGAANVQARSTHASPAAHHSLRQPVTDQNFYFVMADRFEVLA